MRPGLPFDSQLSLSSPCYLVEISIRASLGRTREVVQLLPRLSYMPDKKEEEEEEEENKKEEVEILFENVYESPRTIGW